MPKVIIQANSNSISVERIQKLTKQIQFIVAKALTVPIEHIGIEVKEFGPWDISKKSFEFEVDANENPERSKNLDERCAMIVKGIRSTLPSHFSMSVWLKLHKGSYGEA